MGKKGKLSTPNRKKKRKRRPTDDRQFRFIFGRMTDLMLRHQKYALLHGYTDWRKYAAGTGL